MKNICIAFVGVCVAVSAVNAASMVCSPNNYGPQSGYGNPGYQMPNGYNPGYTGNQGYGSPYQHQGYNPNQGYNNYPQGSQYPYPQGGQYPYAPQQQAMQYNGMTPPAGMMIQQPMAPMASYANAAQPMVGARCTCQKTGTSAALQTQAGTLQAQGLNVVTENGVIKVYDPTTGAISGTAAAKKPGVKVIYDDSHPNDDAVLIRPTNMSQEQKSALESQVTGIPVASSSASFNSALAGMTSFNTAVATPTTVVPIA
ncbi:MAG: hypothetical protein ACK4V2_07060 [Pseudomonadota bacterium]|jgi:hypothetical protein|nr:hypothetical protein [Alphaproteobacteria bacterium]